MAVQRSRRLRKKLHLDEFQELGFTISWKFAEGTQGEEIDSTLDTFIAEAINPNGLAYEGSGYIQWDGLVCLQKIGKCTDEHRKLVIDWLEKRGLKEIKASSLFDIWWDYPEEA